MHGSSAKTTSHPNPSPPQKNIIGYSIRCFDITCMASKRASAWLFSQDLAKSSLTPTPPPRKDITEYSI
eukprot:5961519-Amphidinium_carterae.2